MNSTEKPFLLYPIGSIDDNSEQVFSFRGYNPVPVTARGRRHERAMITVDFFDLDIREDLIRQRCNIIQSMYGALKMRGLGSADEQREAQKQIDTLLSNERNHANCARAHHRLFTNDVQAAFRFYQRANEYLQTY